MFLSLLIVSGVLLEEVSDCLDDVVLVFDFKVGEDGEVEDFLPDLVGGGKGVVPVEEGIVVKRFVVDANGDVIGSKVFDEFIADIFVQANDVEVPGAGFGREFNGQIF